MYGTYHTFSILSIRYLTSEAHCSNQQPAVKPKSSSNSNTQVNKTAGLAMGIKEHDIATIKRKSFFEHNFRFFFVYLFQILISI